MSGSRWGAIAERAWDRLAGLIAPADFTLTPKTAASGCWAFLGAMCAAYLIAVTSPAVSGEATRAALLCSCMGGVVPSAILGGYIAQSQASDHTRMQALTARSALEYVRDGLIVAGIGSAVALSCALCASAALAALGIGSAPVAIIATSVLMGICGVSGLVLVGAAFEDDVPR